MTTRAMATPRWAPARWLRAGAVACALGSALPAPVHATRWQVLDWPMPERVRQARVVAWNGQPTVLATSRVRLPDKTEATAMHMLRLGPTQVNAQAQWTVPGEMRWVEPFTLGAGHQEWL